MPRVYAFLIFVNRAILPPGFHARFVVLATVPVDLWEVALSCGSLGETKFVGVCQFSCLDFSLSLLSPCSVDVPLLMLMEKNKENREQRYKHVLQNAGVCLEARTWALLACYPSSRAPLAGYLSIFIH